MPDYSYDNRSRHRHRSREPEPKYVSEATYIEHEGRDAPVRNLVYRPARKDSIKDVPHDFLPPDADFRHTKYREYTPPGRGHRDYNDDDYEQRPKLQRRKSVVDNLKEFGKAAGLGGVIGAVTERYSSRSRSRTRRKERYDRGYDGEYDGKYHDDRGSRCYSSSERSRSRGGKSKKNEKWNQAAKAAIVAGAVEAFRSRKTQGPWTGAKGQRIATAALGAAGIDSFVDKNPGKHGKRHVAESAIGGLVASRLANGSRSRSRGRGRGGSQSPSYSRSRSRFILRRSRSRGRSTSRGREEGGDSALKNVAGAGAVLAAGKTLYDRVRSKSRGAKGRDGSSSMSSEDNYVPYRSQRNRGYFDPGRSMDGHSEARGPASQDRSLATTVKSGAGGGELNKGKYDSSDSESTTDMEQRRKKLRGKELLTAGVATVATVRAAHSVYTSMAASENRRKLVSEGEISAEEARRRKSKNMLHDAAAVGIAALGIKSVFSEWREMNEQRHGVKELETRCRKRRMMHEHCEKETR